MEPYRFNVIKLTPEQARAEAAQPHWSHRKFGETITDIRRPSTDMKTAPDLSLTLLKRDLEGWALFIGPRDGKEKHVYIGQRRFKEKGGRPFTESIGVSVSYNGPMGPPGPPLIYAYAPIDGIGDAIITGALLGDYNHDGKTDILVQLSNGGAYVFEQTGQQYHRKPVSCYTWPG